MEARQYYDNVVTVTWTSTLPTSTPANKKVNCPAGVGLPAGGVITLADGQIVELNGGAIYRPTCTYISPPAIIANGGGGTE